MATAATPQDRRPKPTGKFSFVHKGKTYTFPKPFAEVQNPKFLRANRHRDDLDMTFTIIEALADDDPDLLAVVDSLSLADFNKLSSRLGKAMTAAIGGSEELGESEAS